MTYTREQFDQDVEAAEKAARAYYDSQQLLMSDADYDALIERIGAGQELHPNWDSRGLLDQVAAGASVGGDVVHPTPMGSLEKVKGDEELTAFLTHAQGPVVVEPKLDGMAVRVEYYDGELTLLATRGDGTTGENITAQAGLIAGLPTALASATGLEVRGEVYMSDSDFEASNSARITSGKKGFANSRNAVAGSLRNTNPGYLVTMSFAAYDATWDDSPDTYYERVSHLRAFGISVATDLVEVAGLHAQEDAVAAVRSLGEMRDQLDFPIDGAVIKVNHDTDRERLGYGSRAPKWAVAYKYAPNEATSILRDIEVGVGRTGRMSLRARIDTVEVGGVAISHATLHNPEFIAQHDLRIGQRVLVVRAGDVIPRVTAAMDGHEGATDSNAWEPPAHCPQCGEAWDKTSVMWRCRTPECSTVGRLTYAVGRDCLDVMGASEAICTALVEAGLVRDLADLLALDEGTLAQVSLGVTDSGKERRIGPVVAAKLAAELHAARTRPLAKVLAALGVRTLGRTLSRRMAAVYSTLTEVRQATAEELSRIDGIGTEKAAIIAEELRELAPMLDRLSPLLETPRAENQTTGALSGMTVVVTGAMTGPLAGMTRTDMNDLIEKHGGKASGSVSAKTSLLVCADSGSSKARKALDLGVPVDTPEEFAARIGVH